MTSEQLVKMMLPGVSARNVADDHFECFGEKINPQWIIETESETLSHYSATKEEAWDKALEAIRDLVSRYFGVFDTYKENLAEFPNK